ncbi:MAG: FCD domain-containing protein [Streptosporangiales bacterium]|nr:FCD domain-containing protein [Streptosporangiales bacterium]
MTDERARTTVTQRAIDRVMEMITSGRLRAGERLPTERELAATLGLSRSSMREAIRALTVMGVLETRHGAGIYVTPLRPGDLLEGFGVLAEVARGEGLVDLLRLRRVVEPAATAMAAARISADALGLVREHLDAMAAREQVEDIVAADLAFHREIVAAAGSPAMSALLEGLSTRTFRARVWRAHRDEGVLPRTREEHERIYAALADRDPAAAHAAAAVHVAEVENWLRANLDEWD